MTQTGPIAQFQVGQPAPLRRPGGPVTGPPLLPAALGMGAGIALDNVWAAPLLAYVAVGGLAVAGLVVGRFRRRYSWLVSAVAAAGLGGILHDNFYRRVSPDHIVQYVTDEPILARVTGTVLSAPKPSRRREHFFSRWMYHPRRTGFLLGASAIEGRDGAISVSGIVAVGVYADIPDVEMGDRVTVFGRIYRPRPPGNPGQFDFARWQRRQGVLVAMRCPSAGNVTRCRSGVNRWRAFLAWIRISAHGVMSGDEAAVSDEHRGLIETMVLGRRHAIDQATEELFRRTGTTHFLAVSGAHVSVVAWFVWLMARWAGGTRRRSAWIVVAAIVLYACVVDPRPPIFRATIIGVVYCLGLVLRRSAHGANSTALAMIILLCIRPTMLFEAGFQMSFVAVFGIIYLHVPLRRALEWPMRKWLDVRGTDAADAGSARPALRLARRTYMGLSRFMAVGLGACLASTPLVAAHFGHIAPLAPINTTVVFPFFAVTLFLGVSTIVVGFMAPALAPVLRFPVDLSAGVLLWVADKLDYISPDLRGGGARVIQIGYIVLLAVVLGFVRIGTATTWQPVRAGIAGLFLPTNAIARWRRRLLLALPLVGLLVAVISFPSEPPEEVLRVTWLSVGRGSSTVIEFPDGRVWLNDCGTNGSYDVGAGTIVPFCQTRGINRVDRVILSHPNMDHYSGLFSVMDHLPTGPIVINRHFDRLSPPGGPAWALLKEVQRQEHPTEILQAPGTWSLPRSHGDAGDADAVRGEVLWPPANLPDNVGPNDSSTVVRLTYRGRSILICGDIEERAIAGLLERGGLSADVLVLPHHGGLVSNTGDFIAAVDPIACLRSSNQPTADTSHERIAVVGGRPLFNTADQGALTLTIDDQGMTISGFRQAPEQMLYSIRHGESETSATIKE